MFGLIYTLTNLVNLKVYVGQTTCSEVKRWREHKCAARKKSPKLAIHRAMAKYGFANFATKVIDSAESQEELNRKEAEWIAKLNSSTFGNGYNLTTGGGGHSPVDPAVREKIGAATKARWEDPATRQHYAENVWTPERRAENGRKSREFYATPEGQAAKEASRARFTKTYICEACKAVLNGRQFQKHTPSKCPASPPLEKRVETEAQRLAHGNAMRGTKRPLDEVARRAAALKKRFAEKPWFIPRPSAAGLKRIGETTRRRMAEKTTWAQERKQWWANHPEAREKMSKRVWSDESRAKARAAANKRWHPVLHEGG